MVSELQGTQFFLSLNFFLKQKQKTQTTKEQGIPVVSDNPLRMMLKQWPSIG